MAKKDNENFAGKELKSQEELLEAYRNDQHPATDMLRKKLDGFRENASNFSLQTLYEIILWKVGRFPKYKEKTADGKTKKVLLTDDNLSGFRKFINIKSLDEVKDDDLAALMKISGIKLPMLSTILFFLNPKVFQIIDVRANHIVFYGTDKYETRLLVSKTKDTGDWFKRAVTYYKMYLEELRKFKKLDFETAGYVLYQIEKDLKIPENISKKDKDGEYEKKCKEIRKHFGYEEAQS